MRKTLKRTLAPESHIKTICQFCSHRASFYPKSAPDIAVRSAFSKSFSPNIPSLLPVRSESKIVLKWNDSKTINRTIAIRSGSSSTMQHGIYRPSQSRTSLWGLAAMLTALRVASDFPRPTYTTHCAWKIISISPDRIWMRHLRFRLLAESSSGHQHPQPRGVIPSFAWYRASRCKRTLRTGGDIVHLYQRGVRKQSPNLARVENGPRPNNAPATSRRASDSNFS